MGGSKRRGRRSSKRSSEECFDLVRRLAALRPDTFRELLWLGDGVDGWLTELAPPWQLRDLIALDESWRLLARSTIRETPPVESQTWRRRAYIERPRGHSKTTDMAVQIAWILQFARRPVSGLAAAADADQARFLLQSLERLVRQNGRLIDDLVFTKHLARNARSGSQLTVISSDVGSSFGAIADFIVCDELCHWRDAGLWNSLLSTAAKRPSCVLTILTNAGVGRGWQWEVREHARSSPDWYFSSLAGPQAPWITPAWLNEQQALLPGPVFRRLWHNEWQVSDGEFVTHGEAAACCDEALSYQSHGRPGVGYLAAIDYAEKHDLTVGCVCHREGDTVIVDRMDVVKPTPTRYTPVDWVERWLYEVGQNFPGVHFVLDEYQLLSVIQKWRGRYSIERFQFRAGQGNADLAQALRHHILHRKVKWYPGCGAVTPNDGTAGAPLVAPDDTLETELASLLLHHAPDGRVRIHHLNDGRHHDDRSFALGVCCLKLQNYQLSIYMVTHPRGEELFDMRF